MYISSTKSPTLSDKCASSTEGMRALPAAIQYLRVAIENVEANQSALHSRLEPVLDSAGDDGKSEGRPPAMKVADIVEDLARRLNAVSAQQRDLLDRLHV